MLRKQNSPDFLLKGTAPFCQQLQQRAHSLSCLKAAQIPTREEKLLSSKTYIWVADEEM